MTAQGLPLPLRLTDAQVASFQHDGFLRVDALTDDAEVEVLLGLYDELFQRAGGFDAGDRIELNADVAREPLPQIVNPERYAPRLIQGLAYRNAREIARQLLGSDCAPTGNHAILKPARIGGATPWHQDEAYWDPRYAHRAVSIWLALQPATLENGCMRFIAGSHRRPVLPHELISADSHGLRLSETTPDAPETICELPAAGATIHDGRTLHGCRAQFVRAAAPGARVWVRPRACPARHAQSLSVATTGMVDSLTQSRTLTHMLRLGVLGLGSVFVGPYRKLIRQLEQSGQARLTAAFDIDRDKTAAIAAMHPSIATPATAAALIARDDVDAVLVLTSMNEHAELAQAALQAGKHVLVEKPMATSIAAARELLRISKSAKGLLVCAPHIVLSPTYRAMHADVHLGKNRQSRARSRTLWMGRPLVGAMVLPAGWRSAFRSRHL